jgi:Skp family chaperone for outer membrane proteins
MMHHPSSETGLRRTGLRRTGLCRTGWRRAGSALLVIALAVVALGLGGCAQARSRVAIVRVTDLEQSWPKFVNYYNQLQANYQAIAASKTNAQEKRRAFAQFQAQQKRWNDEVTGEVRAAVNDIAKQRNYQLVVTREGTAYGGDDITPEVEKALHITPVSPSPR